MIEIQGKIERLNSYKIYARTNVKSNLMFKNRMALWDAVYHPEYYFEHLMYISRQNTNSLRNLCFLTEHRKTDWEDFMADNLYTNSLGSCDSRYSIKPAQVSQNTTATYSVFRKTLKIKYQNVRETAFEHVHILTEIITS